MRNEVVVLPDDLPDEVVCLPDDLPDEVVGLPDDLPDEVVVLPDDLPDEVVVEHVLPLDGGELLLDELADVGEILRGVHWGRNRSLAQL